MPREINNLPLEQLTVQRLKLQSRLIKTLLHVTRAVLPMSHGSMAVCQNPDLKSNVDKWEALPTAFRHASIRGKRYESCPRSRQKRMDPSDFFTRTTLAKDEAAGLITSCWSISSTWASINFYEHAGDGTNGFTTCGLPAPQWLIRSPAAASHFCTSFVE